MRSRRHTIIVTAAIAVVTIVGIAGAGARINTTRSFPVGLYWQITTPPVIGDVVLVCPPATPLFAEARRRGYIGPGFCPGGYGYLFKRWVAGGGDHVVARPEGVWINGRLLPNSRSFAEDTAGRPLPRPSAVQYTVGTTEVVLMSDFSERSFDSRYYGAIDRAAIRGVVRPIFTW